MTICKEKNNQQC